MIVLFGLYLLVVTHLEVTGLTPLRSGTIS
jgi:hypothetical protein